MHVAIVENSPLTHHGQVGVALNEAGARIEIFRPFADGRLPEAGGHDALVVFGGEQSALDDAEHPYIPELARRMAAAARGNVAVLGICLGSQILARGLGAQNRLGVAREFGWCRVERCGDGAGDPLLGALPRDRFLVPQWHSDTFSLPPGAAHLARSETAEVQAYRVGRAGYGFQFHFEANRAVMADWLRCFPAAIAGMDPAFAADHPRRAATEGAEADAIGLALARGWVGLIAAGPAR
jgi:GMP synthase (glutamine-hydrolysing)